MEIALMQAKKSCPFIHVASASSLRRLMGKNNLLLNKAKSCPIMGQALSARSISTSANGKTEVKIRKKSILVILISNIH